MTTIDCAAAAKLLAEISAANPFADGDLAALERHLDTCESCRRERRRQSLLRDALQGLAEQTSGLRPSELLEARLRSEFLRQAARSRAAEARRAWILAAAAALALACGAGAWWMSRQDQPRRLAQSPPGESSAAIVSEFIVIDPTRPFTIYDQGRIMRVTLPSSAPAYLGLRDFPVRQGQGIEADVLLGEDGVARAVRFVDSGMRPADSFRGP